MDDFIRDSPGTEGVITWNWCACMGTVTHDSA